MNNIVWHDRYNMGVDFIDREHRLLFSTMDRLLKLIENEEKSEWVCREGVKYLKNHTVEHFEHEEQYMQSIDYPDYETHKRLHDNFRNKTLPALEQEIEENYYSEDSIRHFLGVCIGWMVAHTQTEDQAITGKASSKWVDLPKEEEIDVLEQVIAQIVYDMLHLKARVISEQYSGENFGKVVCFRFDYRGEKKDKWEIILVFEEQLLIKVIGNMTDTQCLRVDDMVLNVTRYVSRQLLERIRESIPSMDLYEMERECLLTHEQLVKTFERTPPSCNLLFDTGEGYFAFCATTADSLRGKIASDINAENAMDEIKRYLNKEKEEKKKILVVDDSDFMRSRICKLLEPHYMVMEAGSSVSGITHIALDRPDLILLDYEMPVCDGRQMLEMIRAERSISDIPVIFLTGRGDRESVKKVMALKPEGYLLKVMPDEEIKENIDDFFEKRRLAQRQESVQE